MKKRKLSWTTLSLFGVLLVGLGILLYPSVSQWWNITRQSYAVDQYEDSVEKMQDKERERLFEEAENYNEEIKAISNPLVNYDQVDNYKDTLQIQGQDVIGFLEIDSINVNMPIYHSTSPDILNIGVGHLEGTTLPIGGEGNHSVLTTHAGAPHARLFTDLLELEEGDTFTITVLDRIMTYEVDQLKTVLPHEVESLEAAEDKDYVTLFTCTPYGINTHRYLVRGHRIENPQPVEEKEDSNYKNIILIALIVTLSLILLLVFRRKKKSSTKI